MYPSCAEYSRRAIAKHGLVIGWAMAVDRLMRCARDELKTAPRVVIAGEWKYYDPVAGNDFWWYRPAGLRYQEPPTGFNRLEQKRAPIAAGVATSSVPPSGARGP
jgi:hypothetical protein